jgi:alpha/beta superfamily hydrolase
MRTEQTWIKSEDAKLYAELHFPDEVPAPAILILHGMNSQGFHLLKIYDRLVKTACREGYAVMLFDFRGVGKSTGKFDYGIGEQQNVKSALNYIASRSEVSHDQIYVVGHSLGGAVSLYALQDETRVKGLVLWSTPKNHNYNVKKFMRRTKGKLSLYAFLVLSRMDKLLNVSSLFRLEVYGIELRPRFVREKLMKLNECEAASKLRNVPLLIVIGDKDVLVGVDEAKAIYQAASEPKKLVIIADADHIYLRKEEELIDRTLDWIREVEMNDFFGVSAALQRNWSHCWY